MRDQEPSSSTISNVARRSGEDVLYINRRRRLRVLSEPSSADHFVRRKLKRSSEAHSTPFRGTNLIAEARF